MPFSVTPTAGRLRWRSRPQPEVIANKPILPRVTEAGSVTLATVSPLTIGMVAANTYVATLCDLFVDKFR